MIRVSKERMTRMRGVDSSAELGGVQRVVARPARATNRNNYMIMAQIVLLMVGLALCVAFIGTTLF